MTGKRFKKQLMSLGVPRTQAEFARRMVSSSKGLLSYDNFYTEILCELKKLIPREIKGHPHPGYIMRPIEWLTPEEHSLMLFPSMLRLRAGYLTSFKEPHIISVDRATHPAMYAVRAFRDLGDAAASACFAISEFQKSVLD